MTQAVSNAFGSPSGSNLVRIVVDYDYTTNSTGRYYTYTIYLELLKGWFNWNGTGSRFYCSWIPGEILVKGQAEGIGSKWGTKSFSKQVNFGNTFAIDVSSRYVSGGTGSSVYVSEQVYEEEQPWQIAVDYAGTDGFSGWAKGPSIYTKVLHFYVDGTLVGGTNADIYRADVGGNYGFNYSVDLYSRLKKTGKFPYNIYAITSTGSNPLLASGSVEVAQVTNLVKVTSIAAGNNKYIVESDSSGKVTENTLTPLVYNITTNINFDESPFELVVDFNGKSFTPSAIQGNSFTVPIDKDKVLDYLIKGETIFPVHIRTIDSSSLVNEFDYTLPEVVDFNRLYEEAVYREVRRLDNGDISVQFAVKYPSSYNITLLSPPVSAYIDNTAYNGNYTFHNIGNNLMLIETIISVSVFGLDKRGVFSAIFTDNISSINIVIDLPAMYDDDVVIGKNSTGVYCQCREFIEGEDVGFSAPANVLAKEFIEDVEDSNIYIGKNETRFNELIEI